MICVTFESYDPNTVFSLRPCTAPVQSSGIWKIEEETTSRSTKIKRKFRRISLRAKQRLSIHDKNRQTDKKPDSQKPAAKHRTPVKPVWKTPEDLRESMNTSKSATCLMKYLGDSSSSAALYNESVAPSPHRVHRPASSLSQHKSVLSRN